MNLLLRSLILAEIDCCFLKLQKKEDEFFASTEAHYSTVSEAHEMVVAILKKNFALDEKMEGTIDEK